MNETVYWKAFSIKSPSSFISHKKCIAQEKAKTFKSFATPFPVLHQPGINIANNDRGHYGKIWLRVLTNHSPRYMFTSFSHIIKCSIAVSKP